MGTGITDEPEAPPSPEVEGLLDLDGPAPTTGWWQRRRGLGGFLAVAGFGTPVVAYLAFIHHYGLNVITRDQWSDVDFVRISRSGHLSFAALWSPWSVERMFFPRLVTLFLGHTTNLNTVTEMYVSALLLFASVALFVLAHRRRAPGTPLAYYAPVVVLCLSLTQYQNTLWGFQVAWYMVFLSLAAVLFVLDRPRVGWIGMAGAAVVAVVGSYSSFQGLIIWPVGLVLLALRRRRPAMLWAWSAGGLIAIVLYFRGLTRPGHTLYALDHPVAGVKFFFFTIGDILGATVPFLAKHGNPLVELFGAVVFVCALWVVVTYVRHPCEGPAALGVAMICYGLLWAVSVTISQSNAGIGGAAPSRFTLYNMLTLTGCYMALLGSPLPRRDSAPIRSAVLGSAAIVALAGTLNGVSGGHATYVSRLDEAVATVHVAQATEAQLNAAEPYLGGATIRVKGPVARRLHLSTFGDPQLLASFERLGLAAGSWSTSTVQHVTPWRDVHTGQGVRVRDDAFAPHQHLVLTECTSGIVSSLSLGAIKRVGVYFSNRTAGSSCGPGTLVIADGQGVLDTRFALAGAPPRTLRYLAVEDATQTQVLAAAELLYG
ncbi:MAG TPA: hypothetical protein VKR22_03105 [Acidimicrobiales bacterium]|nr:hypothetical protein [Acidimicrobiales bacterium]